MSDPNIDVLASDGFTFTEAAGSEGKVWDVILVRAGVSKNNVLYPDAVLREAVKVFEGVRCYVKSDQEHQDKDVKNAEKIFGWFSGVKFVEGAKADTGHLAAQLNVAAGMSSLRETIVDAWKRGKKDLVGLSINAYGKVKKAARAGAARVAESITKVSSVDLIVEPGAGGALVRLVEAAHEQEPDPMKNRMLETIKTKRPDIFAKIDPATVTDEALEAHYAEALKPAPAAEEPKPGSEPVTRDELRMVEARAHARSAIAASNLPKPAQERLQKRFDGLSRFAEADVANEITSEREYLARFTESGTVNLGGLDGSVSVEDRSKKVRHMLDAFFNPGGKDAEGKEYPRVASFKECYVEITGDSKVTGRIENMNRTRLAESLGVAFRESLDTTAFADVLGTTLRRTLVADYRRPSQYDVWRQIANVVPVQDFRTNERTRFGGYGDLSTVAEGDSYLALSSPTDEKATYAVSKKGGTEDITLEMIKNDDVGSIRRIPIALSRAAKRTVAKLVLDLIRTNPTLYDSVAFFHNTHANLGSSALDATSLAAARLRMLKQAEADSSDRLGIPPKFLLVPADLEQTAVDLFKLATNNDKSFIADLSLTVLPVWYWTDTNDWSIGADPMDLPSIEVGFLDGNEEPELFVQDNPTVGSMFSNDKLTFKIRQIAGAQVINFRGFDKSVVA